MSHIDVVVVL